MPARSKGWLLAGYAGLAGFVVLETMARQRGHAASLEASEADGGSTRAVAASYAAAGLSAPLWRQVPVPPLPGPLQPVGLGLQAGGLGLRLWSMRSLDESYTRTLKVSNAQSVVDRGPYRRIRHPGYLGSLLNWFGFALTSGSPAVVAAVATAIVPPYVLRIEAEEELLRKELAGYDEYCTRTWRLIPYVW
jgi:protein-S-isoprenylcysteine O-methyltransferase Ste14